MIDRIQGTPYYGQSQTYEKKVKSNTETFSMDGGAQEFLLQKEGARKGKKEDSLVIEKLLAEEGDASNGVELDLSNPQLKGTANPQHKNERMGASFSERVKTLWAEIRAAFLRFFHQEVEVIPEKEITVENTIQEESDSRQAQFSQEQMREELLERLYEQGERMPARNSDLLTSYDKYGTIVKMDPGDRNRILHLHPHHIDEKF